MFDALVGNQRILFWVPIGLALIHMLLLSGVIVWLVNYPTPDAWPIYFWLLVAWASFVAGYRAVCIACRPALEKEEFKGDE